MSERNRFGEPAFVAGPAGRLAVYEQGEAAAPAVVMTHSILSASMMWEAQADWLAARGFRVVRIDTRGHGASDAPAAPYGMADLVADTIAALDALSIARAHYVGLSLGGMSGFGLGIHHADRLLSLCLCAARADTPHDGRAVWADRIAAAREGGCAALAGSTVERWFGKAFVQSRPQVAQRFAAQAAATPVEGFVGCAQAIQDMDYLPALARAAVPVPTTLVVGANDGPLPAAMAHIRTLIPDAELDVIPDAGHLPNIDQPAAFQAALAGHFERVEARR